MENWEGWDAIPEGKSLPKPVLPVPPCPPQFLPEHIAGAVRNCEGIAQAWKSSQSWNLLFKSFFWLTSLPSFQESWRRGNAHLPCLHSWTQGGWRREFPVEELLLWGGWPGLKSDFGGELWEGERAERSLVSVLSGWLGYCHDLTASACQTGLKSWRWFAENEKVKPSHKYFQCCLCFPGFSWAPAI